MPESKKPEEAPKAKPAPVGDAGSSTNPLVQQAIAKLEIAERNDDKQAAAAAKATLTDLGVAL